MALTAQKPATRRKTSYALPDSSGNWNFAKATGTLNLKGVLHIALGKRSVAMKSVTFTRPAKGNGRVTAKIDGADGSSLTLPFNGGIGGGSFDHGTLTGTIPLSGGLQLDNGNVSASLTNPELTLGTGTEGSGLSFQLNGSPEVKLFDIDTSQLEQAATPNGTLDLNGLLATLSSEGASSLNTILGQNVFTTGEPVGGVSVILPAASAG